MSLSRRLAGAVAGVLSAGAGLAVATLAAAVLRPGADPLVAVGGAVIDATPRPLKDFAIRTFGTNDKLVLLLSMGAVITLAAAALGVLALRRRNLALAGATALSLVGAAAAMTRPRAQPLDVVPALLGGIAAPAVLLLLLRALQPAPATGAPAATAAATGAPAATGTGVPAGAAPGASATSATPARLTARRRFLFTATAVGLGAVAAGAAAVGLRTAATRRADQARAAVRLPKPAEPATAVNPPDFMTANKDFYRVDTALTVPRIDPDTWELRLTGMVERPRTLTLDQLLDRPLIERDITLNCVSNEVGGPYVGTARWLGAPLATLLREAGIRSGADQLIARSVDGMTIGTPLDVLLDGRDAMLAVAMNGEPLPLEHGFPVRMLTPGLYGYVGACKWVVELEVTRFDAVDAYWVKRGWAARAPVKTASRIDRPGAFAPVAPGAVIVAGVAWAQHRGITSVEVQIDGGVWRPVSLARVPSIDTWVQWTLPWQATKGEHTLRVRATDGTGTVQDERRAAPFPSGATGWHTVAVTVS